MHAVKPRQAVLAANTGVLAVACASDSIELKVPPATLIWITASAGVILAQFKRAA